MCSMTLRHLALLLLLGPLHRLLWQRLALALSRSLLSRSLFPLFLFFCFFVLFVGLCVVSALCAHLFVSLNYVLFIMACWLVTHKNIKIIMTLSLVLTLCQLASSCAFFGVHMHNALRVP